MSEMPSNPFVLPGFGQTGDSATNPLLASLEMMRKAFAGLGGPAGMSGGLGLSPPMNPEELERKIAELKSVENWLKLNLSMLSSTIQGMEVQLATIATLKSFMAAGAPNAQGANAQAAPASWFGGWPATPAQSDDRPQSQPEPPAQSPLQPQTRTATASSDESQASARGASNAEQGAGTTASAAAPAAAQAWWDMLQQQFSQVAAATAASMALKPAPATGKASAKTARAAKKAPIKAAAKAPRKAATKNNAKKTS